MIYRYTYTCPHGAGSGTVVARSAHTARAKAWQTVTRGAAFQGFGPADIRVKRGALVAA